jgi:hypothetical protein
VSLIDRLLATIFPIVASVSSGDQGLDLRRSRYDRQMTADAGHQGRLPFSRNRRGYDVEEVDRCLADLGTQLDTAQTRITDLEAHLARLRTNYHRPVYLTGPAVRAARDVVAKAQAMYSDADRRLRDARAEAESIEAKAYDDAVAARREFEAALQARRSREDDVDAILARLDAETLGAGARASESADAAAARRREDAQRNAPRVGSKPAAGRPHSLDQA